MASKNISDPKYICSTHRSETIQMYCSNCDHTVCFKCISGTHRGHHFDTIEDIVHKKREEISKYFTTVEDIISSFTSALESVKRNHQAYSRETETLTEKVNNKREEWKKQIDEIADTVLSQMKTMTDKDLKELTEKETTLAKNLEELNKFLKTCKEIEQTADDLSIVKLISDFKEKEKSQKSCPAEMNVCPPHFFGDKIDTGHLKEIFGRMVKDDEEAASDFVGSVHHTKAHIDTTTVTTIKKPSRVTHTSFVSTVSVDKAWVGYRNHDIVISLVTKGGEVLQTVDLGYKLGDVTTTNTDEVLVTDSDNHQVKKYTKDGHYISTIMNTSPYIPQGLCTTSDNDILVCLDQSNKDNRVIRVTTTGQTKQTIQHDKQNKPLYTNPILVQENINKDVCVIDTINALVVVNKDGELRFRYPDKSSHSTRIECNGIVCDRLGNILLSDWENHRIHLIDINGHFVQYVLNEQHGIRRPWGLSINNKGELWVCQNGPNEVRIVKYNS